MLDHYCEGYRGWGPWLTGHIFKLGEYLQAQRKMLENPQDKLWDENLQYMLVQVSHHIAMTRLIGA